MLKLSKYILFLLFFSLPAQAQTPTESKSDEQVVAGFLGNDSLRTMSPGERVTAAAMYLLNTPYVEARLEGNEEERLVVNLRELDCMTLVENALALSRASQYPLPDYDLFCRELKKIRYRGGIIDGYTSRLHYTSDWITDNVRKDVVEDVTHALGGKQISMNLSFMSTHPASYTALKNNPEEVAAIREVEETINLRKYYYIPKQEITEKQAQIKTGDILCFTTSVPGLDISHVAIAYWLKGELTFLHASSKAKRVIINTESLADYCTIRKSNTGIIVLRAKE